jgi:3-phosphoshikimate 1-carboxyvinyltransferase
MYKLSKPDRTLKGEITLTASKSESNRALIIQALSREPIKLNNLAKAKDTQTLIEILDKDKNHYKDNIEYDVGPAGTTMRFLTAYFATKPGTRILTGSERMKQRPIKPLVDVLNNLGAKITYLEKEGYPPLKITGTLLTRNQVEIDGSMSSQYTTALLLISPQLFNGLVLQFKGEVTSRPYINMTLEIMEHFNVVGTWEGSSISVSNQQYSAEEDETYTIEADWSAVSYWYSMAALATEVDLKIMGLNENSLQGDRTLKDIYTMFGVRTEFIEGGIHLTKSKPVMQAIGLDFSDCPDVAQTVAVTAAGLKIPILLSGLHTLKIKETDRISAIINELKKFGVNAVETLPNTIEIKEYPPELSIPQLAVSTYDDHRMAMAFAPLALVCKSITIENPEVVDKSYPGFWDDLKKIGFVIEKVT